jgi:hypothetical protein
MTEPPRLPPAPASSKDEEDRALLEWLQRGSGWLRAVTCTLARRGARFRRDEPERARTLLAELSRSPLCKAGQFLFDLLEWEDFMLDGSAPAALSTTLDAAALNRVAGMLRAVQSHLDGAAPAAETPLLALYASATATEADGELPPLEGGFYLYHDVLLGILQSALPLVLAQRK